ncbi:glycosyltransferase family 2 protein [Cyanobium sp. ATX-6F1]|uniref:glycosyltransferase family 2 protein n=1 Tax=Cyanobium sp. ATX-6F1 TaxID=3137388 RepID=UPI0039BE269D
MPSPYTIVTAARDRSAQLRRTAASISRHGTHAEHLIVDWSSDPPITAADLPADARLRLLRVEGEQQWWLSRAYNHGFGQARHPWILKADADALLEEPFFAGFDPAAATLQIRQLPGGLMGLEGPKGAANLDDLGLFAVERLALVDVGGFNPYLLGWGFDDIDLFERLFLRPGATLAHLAPAGVSSLPHGVALRLGAPEQHPEPTSPWLRTWARRWQVLRQQAHLEANRTMAALTRFSPAAPAARLEASASVLHRLPPAVLLERRRALLRGWLRRLIGRHGAAVASAVPAAWLPRLLRWLSISDLPRLPAAAPPH